MADIKNKNELKRRIDLFLDEFTHDEYVANEEFCKETMQMMREFIGHTSHQIDCKNSKIEKLQKELKALKEKSMPKKYISQAMISYCPTCKERLYSEHFNVGYCKCGQRITA